MNVIRVGIADDQELLRTGLTLIVDAQRDLEVVGHAADGVEAVRLAREARPDVLLMDVRMPRMTGVDATRRILSEGLGTRVLVLTMFDLDEYVYAAIRAGASGFLLKDSPRSGLIQAIRAVVAGDALLAPQVIQRLVEHHAGQKPMPAGLSRALESLTRRERDVLLAVAQGQSNAEIAVNLSIGGATVKTHVARLLTKLGLRDRVQLVVFAYDVGIVAPGIKVSSLNLSPATESPRRC